MVDLTDIRSLSDFQRHTKQHLRHIKRSGSPLVLTVNGKASVVIQDAGANQKLLEEVETARTREAVESAIKGEGVSVKEAFAAVRKRVEKRKA